jgi:hypothetical protein
MNYWALDDPLFVDGYYVEAWELVHFGQFAAEIQEFLRSEAKRGNKIRGISFPTVFLSSPPTTGVLGLPDGFSFLCPIQHQGVRVYDGDEDGVCLHLESGARFCWSGHKAAVEQVDQDWQLLYAQLLGVLAQHGVNDPMGDGDFFLVDDDYGSSQQKVECTNADAFTPGLVSDVQKLLQSFPAEWEVIFVLPSSQVGQRVFVVKAESIVHHTA